MADAIYLDANPVTYWALGRAGSAKDKEQRCHAAFETLVAGPDSLACSPITLAEFSSTLWSVVRSDNTDVAYFDASAATGAVDALMGLIVSGRLRVDNLLPRAFEVGLAIVSAGTKEHGRNFRAWDAIHLYQAAQWARLIDRQVTVATSDADFSNIIGTFPEFGRYVSLRDLSQ